MLVIGRSSYFKLFKKISRLILEHDKIEVLVLRDAAIDWGARVSILLYLCSSLSAHLKCMCVGLSVDRDLFMAKERKCLPQDAKEINFDSFVRVTIFELTDIFTRGCHEDEYLDFVRRLCVGLFVQKDGKVYWRDDADITYKHWLATRRKGTIVRLNCRKSCLMQIPARSKSETEHVLADTKRRDQAGLKSDAKTPVFTSIFILNDTISRIYRGKLVADLFVNNSTNANIDPVRYFALTETIA